MTEMKKVKIALGYMSISTFSKYYLNILLKLNIFDNKLINYYNTVKQLNIQINGLNQSNVNIFKKI